MKFLIDRCAGRKLAEWLVAEGHDTVDSRALGKDPGDLRLLELAATEDRAVVTIDTDFGKLVFVEEVPHCGIIRLPDVPAHRRIELMKEVIDRYSDEITSGAIITIRGGRIRISHKPSPLQDNPGPDTAAE